MPLQNDLLTPFELGTDPALRAVGAVFGPLPVLIIDEQMAESELDTTPAVGNKDVMAHPPTQDGQCTQRELSPEQQAIIGNAVELAMKLFPEIANDCNLHSAMSSLAGEAFRLEDEAYTMADAEAWGEGFQIPNATIDRDVSEYAAYGYDLQQLAARRIAISAGDRLGPFTPLATILSPDNPDASRVHTLATEGMSLLVAPDFLPNSSLQIRPPLRPKYIATKSAVNRLLYTNFYEKGLAIVIPYTELCKGPDRNRVHLSPLSWAPKFGTPKGRPIGDCSDGGDGGMSLNSQYTKDACDEAWGSICHPTIKDIANMVDLYVSAPRDREDPGSSVVMWKMDLKGAYTLLSFRTKDVPLLGMEMTDDLVMFFLCGIFGWTGTPACFQVITRAISFELNRTLRGSALMYVDDIFGVCRARDLTHDMAATERICTSLLGSDSIEQQKSESGLRLSVIGYEIDLTTCIVTVARKNVLKALYGFFCTDVDAPITVKVLQKLASYASRYGEICRYMKPFVRALYAAYTGRRTKDAFAVTPTARISILVFRVLLSLTTVFETQFSRDLSSFRVRPPKWVVEFDASLTGIGILWYRRSNSESPEVLLGGCSLDIKSLGFGTDASYQNTAEFIAATLGIRGLTAFPWTPGESVELRGDSITALTWGRKRGVRSPLATNASVLFALQCLAMKVDIGTVTHIPADENWRADKLSRGVTMEGLAGMDKSIRVDSLRTVDLKPDKALTLCDPNYDSFSSLGVFNEFWQKVRSLVSDPAVITLEPSPRPSPRQLLP
jgi:hypothetical protein